MSVSEAQKKATTNYQRNNYDRILLRVPKGKRDEIKKQAENKKMTVNQYLIHLIDNDK